MLWFIQITISDNGSPPLSSTTRVVVIVDDVNDNSPQFEQNFYHVAIPETRNGDSPSAQVSLDMKHASLCNSLMLNFAMSYSYIVYFIKHQCVSNRILLLR